MSSRPDRAAIASPRPAIALVQTARARAFLHDRDYVVPEDIFVLAADIILHRIRLTYEAIAQGRTGDQILAELIDSMA